MYDYTCDSCRLSEELVVAYVDRHLSQPHSCGGTLLREEVSAFKLGSEPYQMKAVLNNGTEVPGHFGKTAKRRRKK